MRRNRSKRSAKKKVAVKAPDPKERSVVVMFADIVGASEVSNHKSPSAYAEFVESFQVLFRAVTQEFAKAWLDQDATDFATARGDEGFFRIDRPAGSDMSGDVDLAVQAALELKRRWLCATENRKRINDGLLPIDLGIGIHTGVVFPSPSQAELEGYSINLAKRIEGHAREGKFTRVMLSEAAHGHLSQMADERTYLFDDFGKIRPKGISRDIGIYEVKHHFLPSDWEDESKESARARSLISAEHLHLKTIGAAVALNPTSLWLAEELIRAAMLVGISKLSDSKRDSHPARKRAFRVAFEQIRSMVQSELRDAGILFILGLLEGEVGEFEAERSRYSEAIKQQPQMGEPHWYWAQSLSFQVSDSVDEGVTWDELGDDDKGRIKEALLHYSAAIERRPNCAWFRYDRGCERARWERSRAERLDGLRDIRNAVDLLPETRKSIENEPYLQHVLEEDIIKKILKDK